MTQQTTEQEPRYDLIAEGHYEPCSVPCPVSWGCIYCDQDELPLAVEAGPCNPLCSPECEAFH